MAKKIMALALSAVLMAALATPSSAGKRAREGDPLPEFTINMLSGDTVKSEDLKKEDTLLITFIQTACSACKGEIVELSKLVKKNDQVRVLPISVDMRSGKDFLEAYKAENGVEFDFGIDPKFTVPLMFGLSFTPATVVVEKGTVTKIHRGYDDAIKAELTRLF